MDEDTAAIFLAFDAPIVPTDFDVELKARSRRRHPIIGSSSESESKLLLSGENGSDEVYPNPALVPHSFGGGHGNNGQHSRPDARLRRGSGSSKKPRRYRDCLVTEEKEYMCDRCIDVAGLLKGADRIPTSRSSVRHHQGNVVNQTNQTTKYLYQNNANPHSHYTSPDIDELEAMKIEIKQLDRIFRLHVRARNFAMTHSNSQMSLGSAGYSNDRSLNTSRSRGHDAEVDSYQSLTRSRSSAKPSSSKGHDNEHEHEHEFDGANGNSRSHMGRSGNPGAPQKQPNEANQHPISPSPTSTPPVQIINTNNINKSSSLNGIHGITPTPTIPEMGSIRGDITVGEWLCRSSLMPGEEGSSLPDSSLADSSDTHRLSGKSASNPLLITVTLDTSHSASAHDDDAPSPQVTTTGGFSNHHLLVIPNTIQQQHHTPKGSHLTDPKDRYHDKCEPYVPSPRYSAIYIDSTRPNTGPDARESVLQIDDTQPLEGSVTSYLPLDADSGPPADAPPGGPITTRVCGPIEQTEKPTALGRIEPMRNCFAENKCFVDGQWVELPPRFAVDTAFNDNYYDSNNEVTKHNRRLARLAAEVQTLTHIDDGAFVQQIDSFHRSTSSGLHDLIRRVASGLTTSITDDVISFIPTPPASKVKAFNQSKLMDSNKTTKGHRNALKSMARPNDPRVLNRSTTSPFDGNRLRTFDTSNHLSGRFTRSNDNLLTAYRGSMDRLDSYSDQPVPKLKRNSSSFNNNPSTNPLLHARSALDHSQSQMTNSNGPHNSGRTATSSRHIPTQRSTQLPIVSRTVGQRLQPNQQTAIHNPYTYQVNRDRKSGGRIVEQDHNDYGQYEFFGF